MCAEVCINKNKHRSFTKYYIINGTTTEHQSILTAHAYTYFYANNLGKYGNIVPRAMPARGRGTHWLWRK